MFGIYRVMIPEKEIGSSPRRKPGSGTSSNNWIPAFAGMKKSMLSICDDTIISEESSPNSLVVQTHFLVARARKQAPKPKRAGRSPLRSPSSNKSEMILL
jgi:hypothetical protein